MSPLPYPCPFGFLYPTIYSDFLVQNDYEALQSDWQIVGDDLRNVLGVPVKCPRVDMDKI